MAGGILAQPTEGLALGPEAQARGLAEARAEIARLAAEAAAR